MDQYNKLAEEYKANNMRLLKLERALPKVEAKSMICKATELRRQIDELKETQSLLQDKLIGIEAAIGRTTRPTANYAAGLPTLNTDRIPVDDEQPHGKD